MTSELEQFKADLEKQLDRLREYIAKMGIEYDFTQQIETPDQDSPLAEFFEYFRIIQDNLRELDEQNKQHVALLDRRVQERTAELEDKVQPIVAQSRTILEQSTPVIQIWDEILVLPLIGVLDTLRAQQVLESLLDAITEARAAVAILDITGVPVVDTSVANNFLKMIAAARMLGAEVILTGVSPYNAQTLVKLGVDLTEITTKASLHAGLKHAFEKTDKRVMSRTHEENGHG